MITVEDIKAELIQIKDKPKFEKMLDFASILTEYFAAMQIMRKMSLDTLNQSIEKNRINVNERIAHSISSMNRKKTTRTRSQGEREALDRISISRWKKAVENGKVKKVQDRVWYYDYRD
jgi:hypothetical protein